MCARVSASIRTRDRESFGGADRGSGARRETSRRGARTSTRNRRQRVSATFCCVAILWLSGIRTEVRIADAVMRGRSHSQPRVRCVTAPLPRCRTSRAIGRFMADHHVRYIAALPAPGYVSARRRSSPRLDCMRRKVLSATPVTYRCRPEPLLSRREWPAVPLGQVRRRGSI